jgi:hypothetical protein
MSSRLPRNRTLGRLRRARLEIAGHRFVNCERNPVVPAGGAYCCRSHMILLLRKPV